MIIQNFKILDQATETLIDYGDNPRQFILVHERYLPPLSVMFYCPKCGDVWAKCEVIADDKRQSWQSYARVCRKCPMHPMSDVPAGSMYFGWDKGFNEALPKELVEREFNIYFDHLNRNGALECQIKQAQQAAHFRALTYASSAQAEPAKPTVSVRL